MRKKIRGIFSAEKQFKREFRRQIRLLITVTLGFTIAFTWRQTVFDLSQTFVEFVTNVQNSAISTILTSTFITLVSIVFIYMAAQWLKDPQENGY